MTTIHFWGEIQGSTIHTSLDVLNETEDSHSLDLELNPTFCRSV